MSVSKVQLASLKGAIHGEFDREIVSIYTVEEMGKSIDPVRPYP